MQLNQSNTRKADQTIFEFQLQTTVMASLHPQIHMIFTAYNGPTSLMHVYTTRQPFTDKQVMLEVGGSNESESPAVKNSRMFETLTDFES